MNRFYSVFGFLIALNVSLAFSQAADGDDIFRSLAPEKNDFYKIHTEPTEKELADSVKKQLEVFKKQEQIFKNNSDFMQNDFQSRMDSFQDQMNKKLGTSKKTEPEPEPVKPKTEKKTTRKKPFFESNRKDPPEPEIKKEPKITKKQQKKNEPEKEATVAATAPKNIKKDTSTTSEKTYTDDAYSKREKFINYGMTLRGIPYVYGGKTPSSGLDCSGFVAYAARQSLNVDLSGNAQNIYDKCKPVAFSEAMPGDLVFFKAPTDSRISHVGIFLGKNTGKNDFGNQYIFLNSASAGPRTGVVISGMNEPYWKRTFYGCGRFIK